MIDHLKSWRNIKMIDRKFKFVAVNPCNNKVYTEENAIILCAKDQAVVAALIADSLW